MARPLRITFPGAFYHVTARGNERKSVFTNKRDREKFLEYLESASQRYQAVIHVFCLMDNHYHLLLETPSGNLPQIMRHINGAYTTYFNTKKSRSGHLFQGRYKAILVEMDEYAKVLSRYIHLNPVRAGMVTTPEAYLWSSYQDYIGDRKTPAWLHRDFILSYFGNRVALAQKGYRDFVESLSDRKYQSPLEKVTGSVVLGSLDFVELVKDRYLGGKKPDRDLPALRQILTGIPMEKVLAWVAEAFGDNPMLKRNAGIYLCRKHTGEKLNTIGNRFGISDAAVSQVCKRFRTRIEGDRKLRKRIEILDNKIVKN